MQRLASKYLGLEQAFTNQIWDLGNRQPYASLKCRSRKARSEETDLGCHSFDQLNRKRYIFRGSVPMSWGQDRSLARFVTHARTLHVEEKSVVMWVLVLVNEYSQVAFSFFCF